MGSKNSRFGLAYESLWIMNDITIIMPTFNKVPKHWAEYHRKVLTEAIGDTPIITISKEPLDWGINLLQTEYGLINIFKQILRGAELAQTSYIAIAEDDTLYPKEHFEYRPPLDTVAYDMTRWILCTWGEPFYFHKPHISNGGMIAPRELLIEAIQERLKNPQDKLGWFKEIGRNDWERKHGFIKRKSVQFYSSQPYVCFNHDFSIDKLERRHKKKVWPVQAYDIPKWGRAEELRKKFI